MRRPLTWSLTLLALVPAAGPRAGDVPAASDVPKGEVTKYTFGPSEIFPGTVRDYWVYIPRQYDPAKPACVYVNQDGIQYNAPAVFDELIHKKEIPVLIGVFVRPGVVKAPSPVALDRFNRSFEYDGLSPDYARFLLEELLPEVEKKTAADGRPIRLSHDGNDRCIAGASSGGICAFTAAWERPDAFRRVFSAIGTFVGLRGGNVYPTLIRKVEPKPIRLFLQDGSHDGNAFGGDWWMANQEMERALTFAGYEVNHAWGDGGHDGRHATQIFPDVMRWLWKDWPAPVKAGLGSPQLRQILIPGEDWKPAARGYGHTHGPAVNARGEVFFLANSKSSYKIGLDDKVSVFLADAKVPLRQAFGPDGRLYVLRDGGEIVAYDDAGDAQPVSKVIGGHDLVIGHDGDLRVTVWRPRTTGTGCMVLTVSPKGEQKGGGAGMLSVGGVALSPDQSLLYVAEPQTRWVNSYQVRPDGSLTYRQHYFHLHVPDWYDGSGAGGMRVDRDGRLWVDTLMGLQVCDQAGRVTCIIPTPNGRGADCCFGGKDFDTLFAFGEDGVYTRKVKVKGVLPFQAPFKPAPPQL
jgi:enterochelin esterase-like enzyme/sugar lactone lactonase YvrE